MIAWAIEALVASTVLMLAVLLLRAPVRKAFGADVAYALWLLPVLRLALPPLPVAWHEAAVAPVLRATEQMTVLLAEPVGLSAPEAAPSLPWLAPALALLWVAGAGGFLAWHTLAHRRFCRRMLDHAASQEEHDGVQVIATSAASGPLAFGIWQRYVAFPRDFDERFEPEERDLALAHELGHHARGDLLANWIALFVLALHWFNPVAWRAFRAFRADQEIANDARVLAGMNPMRRHTYACAILKAAHGGAVSAACHLHTIDDLKGRLRMLTTNKTSRTRLIGGGVAVAALTLGGLGVTASGSQAAERMRSSVHEVTGVDIAALVPPAPPEPAPPAAAPAEQEPHAKPAPKPPAAPEVVADEADAAVPPEPPVMVEPPRAPHGTYSITIDKDGRKIVRYGRYVKVKRDGSSVMVGEIKPIPAIPAIPHIPAVPPIPAIPAIPRMMVLSQPCGAAAAGERMVLRDEKKGVRRVIICTDRIAAVAAKGAAMAANSVDIQRDAYTHALEGLRRARERMATRAFADAQRQAALAGIDSAIAEMEAQLAKVR